VLNVLSRKLRGFPLRAILHSLAKMVLAAALMGEAVWLATRNIGSNAGLGALGGIGLGVIVGVVVYTAIMAVLGSPELDSLRARLARRSPATAE
jgi:peptidoglycan biosynthesis protein MviN/MurJ (putative lipid II flippase)